MGSLECSSRKLEMFGLRNGLSNLLYVTFGRPSIKLGVPTILGATDDLLKSLPMRGSIYRAWHAKMHTYWYFCRGMLGALSVKRWLSFQSTEGEPRFAKGLGSRRALWISHRGMLNAPLVNRGLPSVNQWPDLVYRNVNSTSKVIP